MSKRKTCRPLLNHVFTSVEPTKMFPKLKYLEEVIVSQEINLKGVYSTY